MKRSYAVLLAVLILAGCAGPSRESGEKADNTTPATETRILVLELGEGTINVEAAPKVSHAEILIKELNQRLTTDDNGLGSARIPPGEYTFVVSGPGFLPATHVHGQVTGYNWPNVLWISRSKPLEIDLSKK